MQIAQGNGNVNQRFAFRTLHDMLSAVVHKHQQDFSCGEPTEEQISLMIEKTPLLSQLLRSLISKITEQESTINLLSNENKKMKTMMESLSHKVTHEEEPVSGTDHECEEYDRNYCLTKTKIIHPPTSPQPKPRRVQSIAVSSSVYESYMSYISHEDGSGTNGNASLEYTTSPLDQIVISDNANSPFPVRHSRMWLPPDEHKHKKRRSSHPHQTRAKSHDRTHLTVPVARD